jgi:hypothetical protein
MGRIAFVLALLIIVLFAADALQAYLSTQIFELMTEALRFEAKPWLTRGLNYSLAQAGTYGIAFFIAGVLFSALGKWSIPLFVPALSIGALHPVSRAVIDGVAPFTSSSHPTFWFYLLSWANWYVPPVAGLLGGVVVYSLRSMRQGTKHAA